ARALWASKTPSSPNAQLVVQNDGNLVIYNAAGNAVWDRISGVLQPPPPHGGGPTSDQLNRIGQAIENALSGTIGVIPIGDEGGITVDDLHFVSANNTIHFHVTIHYKQSGLLGLSLYDFKTFYEGDIDITDPVQSIENTKYGFDLNVPGRGTEHVAL